MNINDVIPGYQDFVEWNYPQANTPDGLVPDSWVDDKGIRHAVIWETGKTEYMRLEKKNNKWELIQGVPF